MLRTLSRRWLALVTPLAWTACASTTTFVEGAAPDAGANPAAVDASTGDAGVTPAGGDAGGGGGADAGGGGADAGAPGTIGGNRPVHVYVPSTYRAGTPMPLVILLHNFTGSGDGIEAYFLLQGLAESRGFLYAHPDGTMNSQGQRFWNATAACCDDEASHVDDVAYLMRVVTDIEANYSVDPKRVFFAGHSNGGFMAYRMACEHAETVAAIVSLSGVMTATAADCRPSGQVSVMHIHGTSDTDILYAGGMRRGAVYPGAQASVDDWVRLDGCSATPTAGTALDLERNLAGAETTTSVYGGCRGGAEVELASIVGAEHVPTLSATFGSAVIDFLLAHPKP